MRRLTASVFNDLAVPQALWTNRNLSTFGRGAVAAAGSSGKKYLRYLPQNSSGSRD
jgi:hypothetical protein